jgi:multidrug efflux pump
MSHSPFARIVDRVFSSITNWYHRRLSSSLDYRPVTALFALVVLGSIPFFFLNTKSELAPAEDQGVLFGLTKGPQYSNLDYTNAFTGRMDKVFASFPETETRFVVNGTNGVNQGFAGMILKPWNERKRSSLQLMPLVQGQLGGIEGMQIFVFSLPPLPGSTGGLPVQMVINSPGDFKTVYETMEKIKAAARKSGLFIVTDSDLNYNTPVIRLHVDASKANDLGVNMQKVGDTLARMVGENYVNRFNLAGRSYEVIPQVTRTNRLTAEELTKYYVISATGQPVPLSTLASVENGTDPNALTHYNQLNSATFQAVPMPGVSMGQAVAFLDKTAQELMPAGFSRDFLSESRQYVHEGNQLTITFAFSLIVIFLVLAAQYESLRDPLVVMISVPLSICGALIPLFLGSGMINGATINIYTQVGLVTLIGLISKHGILMVTFANELQRNDNLDRRSAIEEAAKVRLRPILMTTAAMVVGLIPLLLANGAGAASRFSIGLVIVSGMSIGTLFTLFVLPAVYTVFAKDHRPAASAAREAEIAKVLRGGDGLAPL